MAFACNLYMLMMKNDDIKVLSVFTVVWYLYIPMISVLYKKTLTIKAEISA